MSKWHDSIKTIYKLCLLADAQQQGSELNDAIKAQCEQLLTEAQMAWVNKQVKEEMAK